LGIKEEPWWQLFLPATVSCCLTRKPTVHVQPNARRCRSAFIMAMAMLMDIVVVADVVATVIVAS